jgi:hypothetical protein
MAFIVLLVVFGGLPAGRIVRLALDGASRAMATPLLPSTQLMQPGLHWE